MFIKPQKFHAPEPAGGSSVAEPPAAPETSNDLDVSSFEPESPAEIERMMSAPDGQQTPPKKDVKPPEAKKEEPATEKPQPAAQLRKAYDESKLRIAELEKQVKEHPEVATLRNQLAKEKEERDAIIKERDSVRARAEEVEKNLAAHDPAMTQPVKELQDKFFKHISRKLENIPAFMGEDGTAKYSSLLNEFQRLPHGTPEFKEAFIEFRENLKEEFFDDTNAAIDLIREGVAHVQERSQLIKTLQTDAQRLAHERRVSEWDGKSKEIDEVFAGALEPAPDAEEKDPFSPLLYFKRAMVEGGDTLKTQAEKLMEMVRYVRKGLRPDKDDDFVGMTPEQVAEARGKAVSDYKQRQAISDRLTAMGVMSALTHRPLVARVKELEAELEKYRASEPPDPTRTAGAEGGGASDGLDHLGELPPIPDEREFH